MNSESYKGIGVANLQLDQVANLNQPVELTLPLTNATVPGGTIHIKITPKFVGSEVGYNIFQSHYLVK